MGARVIGVIRGRMRGIHWALLGGSTALLVGALGVRIASSRGLLEPP